MNCLPTSEQIAYYQTNGFVVIEDFLTPDEAARWQRALASGRERL
ncbi:MAG TPA: hypothetical protein VGR89_03920 [Puia sp.]|nr:hypothetical protein [Puia sp.]